ncbi:MAG: amidohydrolase family protein [Ilumatobacteraceae bacterium]|nr:amidohydrolase family protein [Ilumatobacteraceae bacterium]
MAEHDLIIRGGTVVDGTGGPRRTADVAVSDGVITEVGRVDGRGTRELDAGGALVAPGFVDVHTHYDGQATWESTMQPSSWHGVTTSVFGNCGVGFAPVHDDDHDRLVQLMEGVEDIPGTALHEGLSWNWNTLTEYLGALDGPKDMDIAAQVPHAALRLHVMGERGAAGDDATPADIAEMGRLAAEGIDAGFLGFTTSRTVNHKTSLGEPTPTLTAARDELVGIAEAIGTTGHGVLQVVSDFVDIDAEFALVRAMTEASGRPISFTLVESPRGYDYHRAILRHIETARDDGLSVTGQTAVRPIGVLLGFECTLNPFLLNPVYREIADLPTTERTAALRTPEVRSRLLGAAGGKDRQAVGGRLIEKFDAMFALGDSPNYEPDMTTTMAAIAEREGRSPADVALDALLENNGTAMLWVPFSNYGQGNLDGTRELLTHPYTVPALSDGGAHVGTICDGSFPTTLLQHWGRDRAGERIDVEFLVQRQCRDTARLVGLDDRGVLAPGYRADINVIDFDRLRVHQPELLYDLPAGGRRIVQRADGYAHTFVAGAETYAEGAATGELPGRLIRGAQTAPETV